MPIENNPSRSMSELVTANLQKLSPPSADLSPSADSKFFDEVTCRSCHSVWRVETRSQITGRRTGECTDCRRARREKEFAGICPALYQETEIFRLPEKPLAAALAWKFQPKGLLFLGETGRGKSRVAWTLLRRVLVEDLPAVKFKWFDCIGFGHEIAMHYKNEDAENWLESLATIDLLFMDDLGKLKLTERAETELFGLIERRCANRKPMIVTTNDTGDTLASRMTDNRGPALIRRLREFCQPIQF